MSRRTERIGLQRIASGTDRNLRKMSQKERQEIRRYAKEVLKEMEEYPQLNLIVAAILTNQHEARRKQRDPTTFKRKPRRN